MDPLELLRKNLQQVLEKFPQSDQLGQPHLMTRALADVTKVFDNPMPELPSRSITKVLQAFRHSGLLVSFLDIKYVCFGLAQDLPDDWRLLENNKFFSKLLQQVDNLKIEPRKFRKCYQGLLSGYFTYSPLDSEIPQSGRQNWEQLREYLKSGISVAQKAMPLASWLIMLTEHLNLLDSKPCERYAQGLLDGNISELRKTLQEGIGIPRESWVWQEVVLSQVEITCRKDDVSFKNDLDRLLRIVRANSMFPENLVIRCVAMLIIRYCQCSAKPEHQNLRDAAVIHIGNPWLKQTAWDAHVKTPKGKPHDEARQMINGWLKRRLIKDFFELLSEDGSADQRRLNYWLRFEPVIEDMWFALGPHANQHRGHEFKEFRSRASGRLIKLESAGSAQNNAFIMQLGSWVIVEFGAKGNACFLFDNEFLPFELKKNWVNGDNTGLKSSRYNERFIHRDSGTAGKRWEQKLDDLICPLIGFRPPQGTFGASQVLRRAARTLHAQPEIGKEQEIMDYIKKYNLPNKDNRPQGGALWINIDNSNWEICKPLSQWGFRYKAGKGWWQE